MESSSGCCGLTCRRAGAQSAASCPWRLLVRLGVVQSNSYPLTCTSHIFRYDVLSRLRPNGVVLINAPWKNLEELEARVPERVKQQIARLRPQVSSGHLGTQRILPTSQKQ